MEIGSEIVSTLTHEKGIVAFKWSDESDVVFVEYIPNKTNKFIDALRFGTKTPRILQPNMSVRSIRTYSREVWSDLVAEGWVAAV
jgi:hypothetical protein